MTKQELLKKLKELKACKSAQEWVTKQPNMETILEDCPHNWRKWALEEGLLEFANHCDWNKLDSWYWSLLLCLQPQFAKHCNWTKLDGWDWSHLLRNQSQFAEHCDWNKLNGYDWSDLLQHQPQFAEHCDWNKLDPDAWSHLLSLQPQFAKYKVQKTEAEHDETGTT